ncbi:serine/threonine phosphatase [Angomonas deanei]|uniref:Calcineurin-like phosphoesterase, putative n=1 Tax=Angomonas deanei TaxID=59799 RepID=A0A7G2CEJ5_9TRYP|nr:serine/threonine phosphatase [Angomonas deanei]CAD2217929.1 Calcineurin-like phosphoesterase, putative [Angomonas deanei]|eukprot:EPY34826.1 serine/threonine phosphatase [Angomonas deanei]
MFLNVYLFISIICLLLSCGCDARRIVALGDLHGDYEQSLAVLRLTRLIDDKNEWIGQDTLLVQLGDVLDVGPDDIKICRLLMKLQATATTKGGDVIQLLGNHELRNFRGDYRAVNPDSLAESGGEKGRDQLLSNQTKLGLYLRTRKAIFHMGPFLFMHGGFSTATSNAISSLKKVEDFNNELTEALVNGTISPLGREGLDLTEDDEDNVANPILVRSILNVKCDDLAKVLDKKFPGINSVVVGHVPHDPRDFDDWRLCNGRLIDIDFGLSSWKKGDKGHVAALEIEDDTWHSQLIEATITLPERENVTILPMSTFHKVLRLVLFCVLVAVTTAFVVYLIRSIERRRKAARERAEYDSL